MAVIKFNTEIKKGGAGSVKITEGEKMLSFSFFLFFFCLFSFHE